MKKLLLSLSFLFVISYHGFCGYSLSINIDPESLFFSGDVNTTTGMQYVTVTGQNSYSLTNYTVSITGTSAAFVPSLSTLYLPANSTITSIVGISFTTGSTPGVKLTGSLSFTPNGYIYYPNPIKLVGQVLPFPPSLCTITTYSDENTDTGVGTTTGSNASGDLRYCVLIANNSYTPATISSGVGSIVLNAPLPDLTNSISFLSSSGTTISGGGLYPIFYNSAGSTFVGLNITFMNGYTDGNGGAINNDGFLLLDQCSFYGNSSTGDGGAINNNNSLLALSYCNFYNNTATGGGGAIETNGKTLISNSNFLSNLSSGCGGAVQQGGNKGNFYVNNSTFAYNSATQCGGSIFDLNSDSTFLTNSTFYGNYTLTNTGEGGIWSSQPLSLINCSIYNNTSSGYSALDLYDYTPVLINTIIANNYDLATQSISDFSGNSGSYPYAGFNNIFTSTVSGVSDGVDGNIINATIGGSLFSGTLADNGGSTWTLAINASSAAFNAGLTSTTFPGFTIPGFDQRGLANFGTKDIGAYEFQGYTQSITGFISSLTYTIGGINRIVFNATATSGLPVAYTISGPAAISGNTLSITGIGVITVTAFQAGNDLYSAVSVTALVTVVPVPSVTGINSEILSSSFAIYPNPSEGVFNIKTGEGSTAITIYTALGEVVYQGSVSGITQVKLTTKGLYLVKFSNALGVAYKKLLIE